MNSDDIYLPIISLLYFRLATSSVVVLENCQRSLAAHRPGFKYNKYVINNISLPTSMWDEITKLFVNALRLEYKKIGAYNNINT